MIIIYSAKKNDRTTRQMNEHYVYNVFLIGLWGYHAF